MTLSASETGSGGRRSRRATSSANLHQRETLLDRDISGRGFGRGGRLTINGADASPTKIPTDPILDVLLDNALRHGAGQVRITARSVGSATAIDIADEGAGIPPGSADVFRRGHGSGHGIGLGLAREFATSMGGRLILSTRTPPVFTLLLPAD
jgi:Histidine kinase-, DNA gyrase B-, and HSP90-like ATPase